MAAVGERRGALRQCTEKILTVVILSAHFHAMFRTVTLTMGLQKSRPDFLQRPGEPAIAHCIRGLGYSN